MEGISTSMVERKVDKCCLGKLQDTEAITEDYMLKNNSKKDGYLVGPQKYTDPKQRA